MAFQNLRTGSKVYIFHKTEDPKLEIGVIVGDVEITDKYPIPQSPSQPTQYPNFSAFTQPKEKEVGFNVKLEDGRTLPIRQLNPTADVENCGKGVFVYCSKDAVNAELIAYKQISDTALDENVLNIHKRISANCAFELSRLNPEIAERQAAEKEKQELRKEVNDLKDSLGEVTNMVRSLLEQFGSPTKK